MISLIDIIVRLNDIGLMDVIIPFLLIFSIMFAIIRNAKILEGTSKVQTFLALAFALMVVVPHVTNSYPPGKDVIVMINSAVPNVTGVLIGAIMFLILIGVFGITFQLQKSGYVGIITLLAMVVVFIIFGSSAGWFDFGIPPWLSFLSDPDVQALAVVLLVFWIIIAMVTAKEPGENDVSGFMRAMNWLGGGFTEDAPATPAAGAPRR